jgi:methylated-DNA-[protein]-cysteine S-methyltransferase
MTSASAAGPPSAPAVLTPRPGQLPAARRALASRALPLACRPRPGQPRLVRRAQLVAIGAAAILLPWCVLLFVSLPATARASNWALAWTGLDVAEAIAAVVTAVLLGRGDSRASLSAMAGATLLLADAWFDLCTSAPGAGRALAIADAAGLELPLAAAAIWLAVRLLAERDPAGGPPPGTGPRLDSRSGRVGRLPGDNAAPPEVTMPVVHTAVGSPIGELTLVADDGVLTGLYFPHHWYRPAASTLGHRSDEGFDEARRQLDEYFAGDRDRFDLAVDARGDEFQRRIWELVAAIPYGQTTSYGELSRELGGQVPAREVGAAVGRNPLCVIIPCHRVVGKNGSLTGYAGGLARKRFLLDLEDPADRLL